VFFFFFRSSNGRMQTHSVRVPNLFATAKAAAVRNRKRKRTAAERFADAELAIPDDPSNWTLQTMESQVQVSML
jgi:hypothetical protein